MFLLKIPKKGCIDMLHKKQFKNLLKDLMEPFLHMDKVVQEKHLVCWGLKK